MTIGPRRVAVVEDEETIREGIDLHALVDDVVGGLRLSTPAADRISVRHAGRAPAIVRGSRERLSQVFENLITNALSFTAPGSVVAVTVDADDGHCVATVADSGPGIPDEHLDRIFDRFFTYRPAEGRREHLGLGLAIARTIVESYGGSVSASNRPRRRRGVSGSIAPRPRRRATIGLMCEFSRQLPGSPIEVITRARHPIEASGGSLRGDGQRGTIHIPTPIGDIVGEYVITGDTIAFRITQKPFLVPCFTIETYVDRFLFA